MLSKRFYFVKSEVEDMTKNLNTQIIPVNLIMREDQQKTYSGTIYRTQSELDLLELLDIKLALEKKDDIGYIDISTILGTYEGHTILSIYQYYYDVYEKLLNQLKETEFEIQVNKNKQHLENKNLRRLYRMINMPIIDLKNDPYRSVNPNRAGCV